MTPQEQQQHQRLAEWAAAKASESLGNERAESLIQEEIRTLVGFVTEVIINREHDMCFDDWRYSQHDSRYDLGPRENRQRIEKPNMENLTSTMTPAYFEQVIAKLAKVDDIRTLPNGCRDIAHVVADDEHLNEFRRLEIADGPMSVTAEVYPNGSILMTRWWNWGDDVECLSATKFDPSGEIDHDVSQIKAELNRALDGSDAAYIQKKYPTFWKALDRITTDLDVPFIGGLHRRHPLQLQWVMSEHGDTCISIDIGIDSVQISNSWNDQVVIKKWPAWLFSGRDRNKNTPPSYEDLMSLIMLPVHRMIIESMDELCDCTEYFSDYSDFYKIFTYSEIVEKLCCDGEALMINESVDYDALLIILPSMDSTYHHRKAAAQKCPADCWCESCLLEDERKAAAKEQS